MDILFPLFLLFLTIYLLGKHKATTPYQTYLQSPHWRITRRKVLARDHYQCTECHSKWRLNVHHLSYAHIGHESLDELQTLCRRCHGKKHNKY